MRNCCFSLSSVGRTNNQFEDFNLGSGTLWRAFSDILKTNLLIKKIINRLLLMTIMVSCSPNGNGLSCLPVREAALLELESHSMSFQWANYYYFLSWNSKTKIKIKDSFPKEDFNVDPLVSGWHPSIGHVAASSVNKYWSVSNIFRT